MANGIRTGSLPTSSLAEALLVNSETGTTQISFNDFSRQMSATGPLSDRVAAYEAVGAVGGIKYLEASLEDLQERTGADNEYAMILHGDERGVYRWAGSTWVWHLELPAIVQQSDAADRAEAAANLADSEGNATAAQLARQGAENAQGLAEDAQNLAEVAQAASETAQGLSEDAQVAAEAARSGADGAAATAVAARDAAIALVGVYADTAAGLAATVSGDQFGVVVGAELVAYLNNGGAAAEKFRMRTSDYFREYRPMRLMAAPELRANKIATNAATGAVSVYDVAVFTAGVSYTFTLDVKAAGFNLVKIYCNSGAVVNAHFDLARGRELTRFGSITPLGGGWFRCQVTVTAVASSSSNVQIQLMTNSGSDTVVGDGVSGVLVSHYSVRVTGSDVSMLPYPDDLTHADWSKIGCTTTTVTVANGDSARALYAAETAFIGRQAGSKLVEASGSVSPVLYRGTGTLDIGVPARMEFIVKRGERSIFNLYKNVDGFNTTFDLSSGRVTSGAGGTIEEIGEGWCRCAVEWTPTVSASYNVQFRVYGDGGSAPYTGDGSSGLFLAGASLTQNGLRKWDYDSLFTNGNWIKLSCSISQYVAQYRTSEKWGFDPAEGLAEAKIAIIGTSITAQGQYTSTLGALSGATIQNLGVSGGSLGAGSASGSLALYNQIPSIATDSDIVILEAGTNDFGKRNTPLGARGDTTTATFYGALYAAINAINAQAPSARIVLTTPFGADSRIPDFSHFTSDGDGNTLADFRDAILITGNLFGVNVVDVGAESGLGHLANDTHTNDGLHPNAVGGRVMGTVIYERLVQMARDSVI